MGISFIGNPFEQEEEYEDEIYNITDDDNIFLLRTAEPVDVESEHTTASEHDDDTSDEDFNVEDELMFDEDEDDSDYHYSYSDDDEDELDYVTFPLNDEDSGDTEKTVDSTSSSSTSDYDMD